MIYQEQNNNGVDRTDTVTVVVTVPVPSDTSTPTIIIPTPTQENQIEPVSTARPLYAFRLSFYDPNIGRYFPDKAQINCLTWDFATQTCNSKLNGGLDDFYVWYRRGLACPPALPMYAKVTVVSPEQLKGTWTCIDRGDLVTDNWLDFLLRYPDQVWTGANLNNFPWGSTVAGYVDMP